MVNYHDGTPFQKGMAFEKIGVELLKKAGFTDIEKLGTTFPVDFLALKDGNKCFIEVRGRSNDAKTQFFYFRPTKVEHMKEASKIFPVYVLLINKSGDRLMTLEDMLSGNHPGIRIFKPHGKGNYIVYDFIKLQRKHVAAMRDEKRMKYEDIVDPRTINRWEVPKCNDIIRISCSEELKQKFKIFRDTYGFTSYWSALHYLLKHYQEPRTPGDRVITAEKGK